MDNSYDASEKLKKLQTVELDLLEKFKGICEKYKLNYFAYGGTLLGAARHKGFIPWDDDIDLFLPWSDYKKLLKIAPGEFQYPYFFQSFLTEEDAEVSMSRLRRSDTTGFTKWEHENIVTAEHDRGIFIDISPLFYVPDSNLVRKYQKKKIMFFWKCIRGYNALLQVEHGKKPNENYVQYIPLYKRISKIMNITKIKWAYLNACAMENHPTKVVGITSIRIHRENVMWNSELYKEYIDLPFENTTIRCPKEYQKALDRQFGDWRTPINNASCHEMVAVDVNTPWKDFDMSSIVI